MENPALWAACAAGDVAARDALLQDNLSLVHYVAKQLSRSLSADADPDEMVNIGTLGLMAALESFDASRGLAFSTYAVPRIRGAILDELRRQDHVPRSIRRKTRDIAQAREALMRTLGRAPQDRELAGQLGIDMDTLWRWQADMERTMQVSLSSSDNARDDVGPAPIDVLPAGGDSAHEVMEQEEEVAALRTAILQLKDQQRTVLSLYYFEELNAREIAEVLGISESRVSQIRSKALSALRGMLRPLAASA
ncbi:MAG: FliA/WhiG family RNA polymerase sigma factor [Gemmatimonadaceae bacterium]